MCLATARATTHRRRTDAMPRERSIPEDAIVRSRSARVGDGGSGLEMEMAFAIRAAGLPDGPREMLYYLRCQHAKLRRAHAQHKNARASGNLYAGIALFTTSGGGKPARSVIWCRRRCSASSLMWTSMGRFLKVAPISVHAGYGPEAGRGPTASSLPTERHTALIGGRMNSSSPCSVRTGRCLIIFAGTRLA